MAYILLPLPNLLATGTIKLLSEIAPKGHALIHAPQFTHFSSFIIALLSSGLISNAPVGQDLLQGLITSDIASYEHAFLHIPHSLHNS